MRLVEEREDETSKKAYREIKSFIGTAKQEGPGLDIESGKGKSKITGNIKGDYFRKKRLRWNDRNVKIIENGGGDCLKTHSSQNVS